MDIAPAEERLCILAQQLAGFHAVAERAIAGRADLQASIRQQADEDGKVWHV
jgi:hypothetical protein